MTRHVPLLFQVLLNIFFSFGNKICYDDKPFYFHPLVLKEVVIIYCFHEWQRNRGASDTTRSLNENLSLKSINNTSTTDLMFIQKGSPPMRHLYSFFFYLIIIQRRWWWRQKTTSLSYSGRKWLCMRKQKYHSRQKLQWIYMNRKWRTL